MLYFMYWLGPLISLVFFLFMDYKQHVSTIIECISFTKRLLTQKKKKLFEKPLQIK